MKIETHSINSRSEIGLNLPVLKIGSHPEVRWFYCPVFRGCFETNQESSMQPNLKKSPKYDHIGILHLETGKNDQKIDEIIN